jgi:hypothetical protein
VRYLGRWNGYEVFEPIFNNDETHCIGVPQFILARNNIVRWTKDNDESFKIMDKLE